MPFPYPKIIDYARSRGGHGNAVSLPQNNRLIVGTRQCRVLTLGNINFDATGFDIIIAANKAGPSKKLLP